MSGAGRISCSGGAGSIAAKRLRSSGANNEIRLVTTASLTSQLRMGSIAPDLRTGLADLWVLGRVGCGTIARF